MQTAMSNLNVQLSDETVRVMLGELKPFEKDKACFSISSLANNARQ